MALPRRLNMAFPNHSPPPGAKIKLLTLLPDRETALAIAVFAGLVSAYMSVTHQPETYLQLTIRSSVSSYVQIFYDIGRGLNEDDSRALPLEGGQAFQALRFPLPDRPIRSLRFDPLTAPGRVVLREATLFRSDGSRPESISLDSLRPTNEIASMRLTPEGLLIETAPQAHDPQTFFAVQYPISPARHALIITLALGVLWFIGAALACSEAKSSRRVSAPLCRLRSSIKHLSPCFCS